MDKKPGNSSLYLSATIANLLAFSCGLAYGWSSPVVPKMKEENLHNPFDHVITSTEESWIVGLLSFGGIFGPIFAGKMADKFGRKKTLILLAFPAVASYFLMAFAKTVLLFYIARFAMGCGIGSAYMILPVYLVEIAEDHNRGALGCLMGVFITSGLLFAYGIGPYLSVQIFCLICTIPLLLFIVLFYIWNPETPQYLATIGDQTNLKASLIKLRNKNVAEIEKEMLSIGKMLQELCQNKGGIKELFSARSSRRGLVITVGVILVQQLSGINAVISYMQTIFGATGSNIPPEISSVIIGIMQVCATILASCFADRWGRRFLLLVATSGSCISLISLGVYFYLFENAFNVASISWLPILSLVVFIISFNLGLASVPWTLMAELFPPHVKSVALTLTTVVCFIGATLTTLCFPSITEFLGMAKSFWLFAACGAIGSFFIFFRVPETKGKSLRELQELLENRS